LDFTGLVVISYRTNFTRHGRACPGHPRLISGM
jgi:hypothetical protein